MRVLLIIPALGPGGAERAMSGLANHLASTGWQVTLATLEAEGSIPFYPLDPAIALVRLDALGGAGLRRLVRILGRFPALRRLVRSTRPAVVVSFMDTMNVVAAWASLGLGVPVVVSERVDPWAHRHRLGTIKSALRSLAYLCADRVVVQTSSVRDRFGPLLRARIEVIPNAVEPAPCTACPDRAGPDGRWRLIGVGRLDRQKGFDLALAAFVRLAPGFPDWDLWIWGEGPERARLEAAAAEAGLSARVYLPGITRDIHAELCTAQAMVFPSRYEGFPNALGEAMACGLPVVGFGDASGVAEMTADGEFGLLIPLSRGAPGLAEVLGRVMSDAVARARMGAAARRHVGGTWRPATVYGRWSELISRFTGEKTPARC